MRKKEIDPILDYLDQLPVEPLNEIERVLRSVFDLGCESGYDALVEAAPHCGGSVCSASRPASSRVAGAPKRFRPQHAVARGTPAPRPVRERPRFSAFDTSASRCFPHAPPLDTQRGGW